MKTLLFVSLLALCACQTTNTVASPEALNKKELRGYFTQNLPTLSWSSKARTSSLGGLRAPPAPIKVQILDTRDSDAVLTDHWQQEKRLKSTIIAFPWNQLMDETQSPRPDVHAQLEKLGLQKYELLLILADSAERARRLAEITFQAGYTKSKYYNAPYTGIADIFAE